MMKLRSLVVFISLICLPISTYAACNIVNGKAYGDCAGVAISNQVKGVITVSSHVSESGIIEGARVVSGGSLRLSGICNGDIAVSKDGTLVVTGIVKGAVINNGGSVEIEGQVSSVYANSGKTTIGGIVSRVNDHSKVTYKRGAVIGGNPKP